MSLSDYGIHLCVDTDHRRSVEAVMGELDQRYWQARTELAEYLARRPSLDPLQVGDTLLRTNARPDDEPLAPAENYRVVARTVKDGETLYALERLP